MTETSAGRANSNDLPVSFSSIASVRWRLVCPPKTNSHPFRDFRGSFKLSISCNRRTRVSGSSGSKKWQCSLSPAMRSWTGVRLVTSGRPSARISKFRKENGTLSLTTPLVIKLRGPLCLLSNPSNHLSYLCDYLGEHISVNPFYFPNFILSTMVFVKLNEPSGDAFRLYQSCPASCISCH